MKTTFDSTDRGGHFAIRDHDIVLGQGPLNLVKRNDGFPCFGKANNDVLTAKLVQVKGMQRLTGFDHDVIGNVDHVVDRANARGNQACLQPCRAWLYDNVFQDSGAIDHAGRSVDRNGDRICFLRFAKVDRR